MDTTTEELSSILERLDAVAAQVDRIAARQAARDELIADLTPIGREALATAIAKLDRLERDGYLAFAVEAVGVAKRVVQGFSPADVRALGDSIVGMLETVRAVTSPDVLEAAPVGMMGVARALRKDDDVRKGMAVMLEVLRRVGQRAEATPPRALGHTSRLSAMLAPRRARPQLPAPTPAPASVRVAPAVAASPRGPACAAPAAAGAADATWSRDKAAHTAAGQGLVLTDAHWAVIDAARADFATSQVSPNIRRLTQIAGVTTRDLYALFPKAPGRAIAAIAGLPKPAGCL